MFRVFPARGTEPQTNTGVLKYNVFALVEVWLKGRQVV